MSTFANSEDPDEMPQNAAFHQDLHCLLTQNRSSEKEMQYFLIITYESSINSMNHPDVYGKAHLSIQMLQNPNEWKIA